MPPVLVAITIATRAAPQRRTAAPTCSRTPESVSSAMRAWRGRAGEDVRARLAALQAAALDAVMRRELTALIEE